MQLPSPFIINEKGISAMLISLPDYICICTFTVLPILNDTTKSDFVKKNPFILHIVVSVYVFFAVVGNLQ